MYVEAIKETVVRNLLRKNNNNRLLQVGILNLLLDVKNALPLIRFSQLRVNFVKS